jgi:hypothetical protein
MELRNTFTDTQIKDVFVDDLTVSGSAFGATPDGEAVFINARVVNALKLSGGEHLRAMVVPNYEDKRDRVQWRTIRAEVQETRPIVDAPMSEELAPDEPEPTVVPKDQQILNLLDEHGPLRTSILARLLGIDSGEAGTLCHGLYAQGKIALADVYSSPSNSRASHRVWAIDINEFDVDPFDQ